MSALVYVLSKSVKNTIKGLIKKPSALIGYIVFICIFLIPSFFSSPGQLPLTDRMGVDAVKSIFMGYILFLFILSIITSLNGASFFRMADVNLLFTSPIKAGYILVYGFIKQQLTNLLILLFLAAQYPNWKKIFGFIDGAGWILIISYILLVTVTSLFGMILYSYILKKSGRMRIVKGIIYGFVVALLLPVIVYVNNTGNIISSIISWFSSDYIKLIPVIGWLREILMGVFFGFSIEILIYILLLFIISLASFLYIYRMDTGYYENVLSGTELREKVLEASRKGKTIYTKTKQRYRKVNARFTLEGSLAVFQKQIIERRKKGLWLLPTKTILMVIGAVVAAISIPADGMVLMLIILAAAAYLTSIIGMAAGWENDISNHYIYLIPASPFSKMLAATLAGVINMFAESLLLFGVTGIILRIDLVNTLSVFLAYAALGTVFIYTDLVARRLFGKGHANVLRLFSRVFLTMIIVFINIIPVIISIAVTENYAAALNVSAVINTILILLFMWIGSGVFKSPELS